MYQENNESLAQFAERVGGQLEERLAKELGIVVCDFSESPLKQLSGETVLSGFVRASFLHQGLRKDFDALIQNLTEEISIPIKKHGFGQMKLFLAPEGEDMLRIVWILYRLFREDDKEIYLGSFENL